MRNGDNVLTMYKTEDSTYKNGEQKNQQLLQTLMYVTLH